MKALPSVLLTLALLFPSTANAARIALQKQSRRTGYATTSQAPSTLLQRQNALIAASKKTIPQKTFRSVTAGFSTLAPKGWAVRTTKKGIEIEGGIYIGSTAVQLRENARRSPSTIIVELYPDHVDSISGMDAWMSKILNYDLEKQEILHPDGRFIPSMGPVTASDTIVAGYQGRLYTFSFGTGTKFSVRYLLLTVGKNTYGIFMTSPLRQADIYDPIFHQFLEKLEFFTPGLDTTARPSQKK